MHHTGFLMRRRSQETKSEEAASEPGMRGSVIRIERCRAPERVHGALSIRGRLAQVVHALEVGLIGRRHGLPRVRQTLRFERCHDGA